MSWEFRLAEKDVTHNEKTTTLYGLVEVYYSKSGKVDGWTDFIDPNGWDNVEDLKVTLQKMLAALDKPVFENKIIDKKE